MLNSCGNFTNSFCGFTSRRVVLRGRTRLELRILTAQDGAATELLLLAKVMTNACPPSRSLLSGHAQFTKKPKAHRNTASFLTVVIL